MVLCHWPKPMLPNMHNNYITNNYIITSNNIIIMITIIINTQISQFFQSDLQRSMQ